MPIVEEMQADLHALVDESGRRQFRRSQVMRRRSSEFGDHGGPSAVTQIPKRLRSDDAGSRQTHQSRDGEAAKATAPPFASPFTSRDGTSIETDRTCGRIQAGNKVPIRGKPPVRSA